MPPKPRRDRDGREYLICWVYNFFPARAYVDDMLSGEDWGPQLMEIPILNGILFDLYLSLFGLMGSLTFDHWDPQFLLWFPKGERQRMPQSIREKLTAI